MTSRPTVPAFKQAFFDAKLPTATAVAPTEAVKEERKQRVSIKTFNGGTMQQFLTAQKRSDFNTHQKQFAAVIDRVSTFAESNATQITPALSKESVNRMKAELNDFKTHVINTDVDYFCAHRGTIYSGGKTALHEIDERLHTDTIALQTRMNILQNMTPGMPMCSGGVMTSLEEALQALRLDGSGLKGMAYQTKAQMVEAVILEHVQANHKYSSGNEVHFVNHYFNTLANAGGLVPREDAYVSIAKPYINPRDIDRCFTKIDAALTPEALALAMADNYLSKVKDAVQEKQGTSNLLGPVGDDDLTKLFEICKAVKHATLDKEFGDVAVGEFVHPVEGSYGMQYQLATNPITVAQHFLQALKGQELVDFDKTLDLSHEDSPNGSLKMLGSLLWVDKDGACEEAKLADILAVSPKEIHNTLTKDGGMSTADSFATLGTLVRQVAQMTANDLTASVPESWVKEVVDLYHRDENNINDFSHAWGNVEPRPATSESPKIDPSWSDPLAIIAVTQGHAGALDVMCGNMVKRNQRFEGGNSLAIYAAGNGHVNSLEVLKKHGTDLSIPNNAGFTPLMAATNMRHVDAVRFLCNSVNNVNPAATGRRITPVMQAASEGYADVLGILLEAGGHVRARDSIGRSALSMAAQNGHGAAIELLLTKGAQVNQDDHYGKPVLMYAIESGSNDAVQKLIAGGASVNQCNLAGASMLMTAASKGDPVIIKTLIDAKAKLDVTNNEGKTALMLAVESNELPAVKALMTAGANLDIKNKGDQNAATIAADLGHMEIYYAIDAKTKLDSTNHDGKTALMLAVESNNLFAVEKLIAAGANLDIKNKGDQDAAMIAADLGHMEIFSRLLSR